MCEIIAMENQNVVSIDDVTRFGFKNMRLRDYTLSILNYAFDMRTNALRIASLLAIIQDNADSLCDEFVGETSKQRFYNYGETVIGLKQAQLLAYAKAGHEFLDSEGHVLLYEPDDASYTISQLQALLPLGKDIADKLAKTGEISPYMTVKELKEVAADNNPKAAQKARKKAEKEALKAEQERVEAEMEAKKNGIVKHQITIREFDSGLWVVMCDDEDITKTRVGKYLIKNLC